MVDKLGGDLADGGEGGGLVFGSDGVKRWDFTPTLGATAQADADGDVIDVIELGGGNGEGCEQWDVERERLD
jgi:hypothetical protein